MTESEGAPDGWFHEELAEAYADLGSHRMRTTLMGGEPPLPAAIIINRKDEL